MRGTVSVLGLGYVGLPLAELCAKKGYIVYGIDIDKEKIKLLKNKIKEKINLGTNPAMIKNSNIVVICVPTPVDEKKLPDLSCLKNAARSISKHLKKGALVIIESTTFPGTTEEVIRPILEKSGLKAGKDFHLAYCPERIDPGNKTWTLENIPRVIGALGKEGLERAYNFYRGIINAEIKKVSSIKTAEATKVVENTFRDVNIAFVNELAQSFEGFGIDVTEVIEAASTKPFAFLPHYPGCGVGGHCIPVDPYYLIERAKQNKFDHKFLKLAREINEGMQDYTINLLLSALKKINKDIKGARIGILGVAYKKGVDDTRESPSLKIISKLKKMGASLAIYDPYVKQKSNVNSINDLLKQSDYAMLLTDHPQFKNLNLKGIKIVIDGRNFLDKDKVTKQGIIYRGIGR